jgi:L-fucose isomerase-like protein
MATFGVIVGNRGFFPDRLAEEGRKGILRAIEESGHKAICLSAEQTDFGSVETRDDAKACAELFRAHAGEIDGVVVTLPNFGDERGVAETLRLAGLDVPVLVQATPDDAAHMTSADRRDSFCGKISVCNNLVQYGIPFTLTRRHTVAVDTGEFAGELDRFAAVCRVVTGLRRCRVGAIGARPSAFNTVRYSEKLLEAYGIAVETIDLSEVFGRVQELAEGDESVAAKVSAIRGYCDTSGVAEEHILKMARLGVVIDEFVEANDLDVCAVQCWTSMEQYYGVVPCTVMSMMSDSLVPSACEVDVGGALAMYALQLASGTPSAILDWNNNYGDDPDRCVCFHCSNVPRHLLKEAKMDFQEIIAGSVGRENTFGTCVGRIRSGPMTFARLTTDDTVGAIRAYVAEGEFTDDEVTTFGGYGVARIAGLQALLEHICRNGFEHHVAVNLSRCGDVVEEAFTTYLGFETYRHG